jgi:hypothetical protein
MIRSATAPTQNWEVNNRRSWKVDPLVRTPIFRKAFRCGDWRNSTGLA